MSVESTIARRFEDIIIKYSTDKEISIDLLQLYVDVLSELNYDTEEEEAYLAQQKKETQITIN